MRKIPKRIPLSDGAGSGLASIIPAFEYLIGSKSAPAGAAPGGIPVSVSVGVTPDLKQTLIKATTIVGASALGTAAIISIARLMR